MSINKRKNPFLCRYHRTVLWDQVSLAGPMTIQLKYNALSAF